MISLNKAVLKFFGGEGRLGGVRLTSHESCFFLFMRKILIEAILGISFCAMGVVAFAGALYLESTTSTASTWHGDGMKAEGTMKNLGISQRYIPLNVWFDFPTFWGSYLRGKCSYIYRYTIH